MRITCPNCEAQYEVEDRLIPEGGRDVQCSNCGHAWYQYPPGSAADDSDEEEEATPPPPPSPPSVNAPAIAGAAAAPAVSRPRPPLDESLRAVLREEAEREAAARAAEARRRRSMAPVETQSDPGIDGAPPPRAPAQSEAGTEPRAARRESLPDIEAINASLGGGSAALPPVSPPSRGGGFVQGFVSVLVLVALLYALYAVAPRIGAAIPALAGPLDAYVGAVDAAHRALAAALRGG